MKKVISYRICRSARSTYRQVHTNISTIQKGHPTCDDGFRISSCRNVCGSSLSFSESFLLSMFTHWPTPKCSTEEPQHFCHYKAREKKISEDSPQFVVRQMVLFSKVLWTLVVMLFERAPGLVNLKKSKNWLLQFKVFKDII